MAKDPVCGMDVPDDAPIRSEYLGVTVRFCSPGCKERFDREPERFMARAETKQARK